MTKSVKEKIIGIKGTVEKEIEKITDSTGDIKNISTDIARQQGKGFRSELKDLEKIRHHEDLIYYKSDAIAIVIRKLGGFDDFLKAMEQLTKEGYWMTNSEDVKSLLANFGINLPGTAKGTLYYFQNKKYIN